MRYHLLDAIRGLALLGMILYHFCYDLTDIFNVSLEWFSGQGIYYWQRINCSVFIILSGICAHFSRHLLKRGLTVSLWGAAISLFTLLFMPEQQILFGILTFLGLMMIFTALAQPLLQYSKKEPRFFLALALVLFLISYYVPQGYFNFIFQQVPIPDSWHNLSFFSNLLGFKTEQFSSADYFPLLPWSFLYLSGYFFWLLLKPDRRRLLGLKIPFLSFIGRHSLLIYLVHQPLIYALLSLYFAL